MGTLYWQLNDTWPAISWSSRDYFGRWKALHYTVREAFAPLMVSIVLRKDTLEVWGISDLDRPVSRTLFLELLDFQGTTLWQAPVEVDLNPLESRILWEESVQDLLGRADPRRVVLVAGLREEGSDSGQQLSGEGSTIREAGCVGHTPSALHYFVAPKDLVLEIPAIRLSLAGDGEETLLTLESRNLAKDVQLTLPGVHFLQNYFDLLPGRARTVRLDTILSQVEVERALRIKTLADVPRDGVEPGSAQGAGRG